MERGLPRSPKPKGPSVVAQFDHRSLNVDPGDTRTRIGPHEVEVEYEEGRKASECRSTYCQVQPRLPGRHRAETSLLRRLGLSPQGEPLARTQRVGSRRQLGDNSARQTDLEIVLLPNELCLGMRHTQGQ